MGTAKSFAPFRTRLIWMVLLLVIPCLGLVLWGNLEQRRIERASVRERAKAIADLAAANERNLVENARELLATLSQLQFLVLGTNKAFVEGNLINLRKLSPEYANFGLIEADGSLFCSAEPTNVPVNLGDRLYFKRVLRTKRFAVGNYQIGRLTAEPTLNFGYPVMDERGRVVRVLYASLMLSKLSDVLGHLPLAPDASLTVFDQEGTVLAHWPKPDKWVGQSLTNVPVVQRILGETSGFFEMPGVDGVPRLHAVSPVTDGNAPALFVSVASPLNASFAPANRALVRNVVVLAMVAMAVLIGASVYAKRFILRPVSALSRAAGRLAEGDLTARAGDIDGSAELVQLGEAFDAMAGRLQRRQAEVEKANDQISHLNQELEKRVDERTAQMDVAIKELEAFSYSVSHDLRAPLRHIDGFVTLLSKDVGENLTDNGRRYLQIITASTRQMGSLIDDLLVFSRMGRSELRWTALDLEALVHKIIEGMQSDLAGRNFKWTISNLPVVQADPAMLQQVLANLIGNAIKYTRPRDPAEIEIRCAVETPEEFIFSVRDNGVGFDMRYVNKLFGVFQRLHRAEEFEGSGIGLANVRRIIERHGGRVWAEGKIDKGATIYFTLPKPPPAPAS